MSIAASIAASTAASIAAMQFYQHSKSHGSDQV